MKMRKWWNWQTHHLEGVAPQGMRVQVPPSAPFLFPRLWIPDLSQLFAFLDLLTKTSRPRIVLFAICLAGWNSYAGSQSAQQIQSSGMYPETLVYSVSWEKFLVAARLTIKRTTNNTLLERKSHLLDFQATTVGPVDRYIYQVNDHYLSLVDSATGLPGEITVQTRHGKKERQAHYLLDQKKRQIKLDSGRIVQIPPRTLDIPSLFYFLRRFDWREGKAEKISLFERGNIYELQARLDGRESISLKGKETPVLRISIRIMAEDSPDDSFQIRLFLSDQPDHKPLLITASPSWGQVRIELEERREAD